MNVQAVSNTILFNSHLGVALYVFFRPHMHRLNLWDRVQFSVFSSGMFNFGSLVLAVLVNVLVPKRYVWCTWTLVFSGTQQSEWANS